MDAVPFVIGEKGAGVRKPLEQYEMLRGFSQFLNWRQGDAIILAEANVLPDTDMEYFGKAGERLQMEQVDVAKTALKETGAKDISPTGEAASKDTAGGRETFGSISDVPEASTRT
jgi:maltose alpha-D-glucosyltransferase/alpha-amylase